MEIQIKKTIKAGNSSAVVLPRAWLNKEVRVELIKKDNKTILFDVLDIIKEHIEFGEIIGIYLTGSYARGEEDANSDIDILVITRNLDKEVISEGMYNILIVSSKLVEQKLKQDLLPIGPMLKEAKALLNSAYLELIDVIVNKNNVSPYIETTENKLKIIKEIIEKIKKKSKKNLSDKIAYTLVLRIRTLYIIKSLIEKNNYSKKDFIKIINNTSRGKTAYEGYLAVKNNQEDEARININEAERLYDYLKIQLGDIKKILK
ncbi:MAG: nucleotidyltransferase domain-containing protein [Nanoarchaeota archaeon]|nr:nucleotidyltransferase domain-containing protein [Nanoarchaeota archaeon]